MSHLDHSRFNTPTKIHRLKAQPLGQAKLLEPRKDLAMQRIAFPRSGR